MSKILVIEDEKKIARFIELELAHEGYSVICAHDGKAGLEQLEAVKPDLLLLDLMLPILSGIEVCRRVRQAGNTIPIIMLTAKDDVTDKVLGLDMGADDYMTKPFAIEELLARIRVALKKNKKSDDFSPIKMGCLSIDKRRYAAYVNDTPLQLTKKEFDLLTYFCEHSGMALSRDQLLNEVWGYNYAGDTNVVDVYVRYLRTKLDDAYGIKCIHTIRGVGYMLNMEA